MDSRLQAMLDEFELRKLVNGYCRAVDRGDIAHLRTLYHQDAADDHGGFSTGSADDFLGELAAALPFIRSMHHSITTVNFAVSGATPRARSTRLRPTPSVRAATTSTSSLADGTSTSTRNVPGHGGSPIAGSSPTGRT